MKLSTFRTWSPQVVFQEVPNHVSLAFTVSGCPLKCDGCHSQDTWPLESGDHLSDEQFQQYLNQYKGLITCVVFFGGEWTPDQLIAKLKIAQAQGLKTCLYSGFENVPYRIRRHLTFLKTGAYIKSLGGLSEATTNQRFIELETGACLNHLFRENDTFNDQQSVIYQRNTETYHVAA